MFQRRNKIFDWCRSEITNFGASLTILKGSVLVRIWGNFYAGFSRTKMSTKQLALSILRECRQLRASITDKLRGKARRKMDLSARMPMRGAQGVK